VRIGCVGGDLAARDVRRQDIARQGMTVRLNALDTTRREHDGSDADAEPIFPGGAQQKTGGRRRRLEPANCV
jgi:hypothetical protein